MATRRSDAPSSRTGRLLSWMPLAAAASLTLSCSPGSEQNGPTHGVRIPVVLVVVDTLRADHLSLYGYTPRTSPMLEKWGGRSAVFERAYATSPWTLPSFASIYTGMLPSRHSAGYLVPAGGDDRHSAPVGMKIHGKTRRFARLDSEVPTLAEILRDAGYATAALVNNPFLNSRFGIARGFDAYDHDEGSDGRSRRADAMVDRALSWIDAHSDGPFFLLLHLFDPHMNYDAPQPIRGRFTAKWANGFTLPVMHTDWLRRNASKLAGAARNFIAAAYDEEVAFVDAEVGRFFSGLEKRGLADEGLVFLTADHGEELFDHESFGHGHTMFEEQLRVPLTVFGKGVAAARHRKPVSIVDITPTILDALGIQTPVEMDGLSLWRVVKDGVEPPARSIVAERRGIGPEQKVVIQWPYKLTAEAAGGSARLYDLVQDPRETKELSASNPKVVSLLREQLHRRYKLDAGNESREAAELEATTIDALRELGYVD